MAQNAVPLALTLTSDVQSTSELLFRQKYSLSSQLSHSPCVLTCVRLSGDPIGSAKSVDVAVFDDSSRSEQKALNAKEFDELEAKVRKGASGLSRLGCAPRQAGAVVMRCVHRTTSTFSQYKAPHAYAHFQIQEGVVQINQSRMVREFMMSLAEAPIESLNAVLASEARQAAVQCASERYLARPDVYVGDECGRET